MLIKKRIGNDTLVFGDGFEVLRLFRRFLKDCEYHYAFANEPTVGFNYDGSPRRYGLLLSWADEDGYYKGETTIEWLTANDVAYIAMSE